MSDWNWLKDIEDNFSHPIPVKEWCGREEILKLLTAIREMKEALEFYADFNKSFCVCPGGSKVAKTDEANETLARLASGSEADGLEKGLLE